MGRDWSGQLWGWPFFLAAIPPLRGPTRNKTARGKNRVAPDGMTDAAESASGDGTDDQERFGAVGNGGGERIVGRCVGEIFRAGKEAKEGAALEGDVVADGAAEHGVLGFEGVEDGALGDGARDFKTDFGADAGEGAEMGGESDADHGT